MGLTFDNERETYRSCHYRSEELRETDQIVGRHGEGEAPSHTWQAPKSRLPLAGDRLCPAENLFNPLADALADGIAGMARRAPVDGRAAALWVLGDMRDGTETPPLPHT